MGDFSRKVDVEKLVSYSDDLVSVLKDQRDVNSLTQCFEHTKALISSCISEFNESQTQLRENQKKIDECLQKTEKAKLETVSDAEMEFLDKERQAELENERALLAELRAIEMEISDFERQRISLEDQKKMRKKLDQDKLREKMKLAMYASVTTVIPNLDDQSKVSGHVVDRDKRTVEKFELDPSNMTEFDLCQTIWKKIIQ